MPLTDMRVDEAPLAEALTFGFGAVAIPRQYVIQQQGKDFVLSDGLLVGLEQLSRGYYDVDTELVQLPTPANDQTAVVRAVVVVFDPADGRVLRRATGLGDASPANVGRMVAAHCLRMAETRALARALRHILGCGMTALEELGGDGPETPQQAPSGAAPRRVAPAPIPAENGASWPETAPVRPGFGSTRLGDRTFTRAEVEGIYARRLDEAKRAGLAGGEVALFPLAEQPTQALVEASAELKRRLEARAGAAGK